MAHPLAGRGLCGPAPATCVAANAGVIAQNFSLYSPRIVSAGSEVLQGECVPGPGVLKRRVRGYLQLQGHKKFRLQALGNACVS